MWSGSSAPEGWTLCNGGSATSRTGGSVSVPDLRNRFIIGAGSSYGVNSTGGSAATSINKDSGDNDVEPTVSDTIQFSVNNHSLSIAELPQHQHGMLHNHGTATGSTGAHSHNVIGGDKFFIGGDGGGAFIFDVHHEDAHGSYQTVARSTDEHPGSTVTVNVGAPSQAMTGGGNNYGLSGTAHGHGSTKTGTVSISNTIHQHNINFTIPTIPPYYALTFIYKL
jgi:hypothetical protein